MTCDYTISWKLEPTRLQFRNFKRFEIWLASQQLACGEPSQISKWCGNSKPQSRVFEISWCILLKGVLSFSQWLTHGRGMIMKAAHGKRNGVSRLIITGTLAAVSFFELLDCDKGTVTLSPSFIRSVHIWLKNIVFNGTISVRPACPSVCLSVWLSVPHYRPGFWIIWGMSEG